MGFGFKISATIVAVVATLAVAAYPASISIGNKIYDEQLEKIKQTNVNGAEIAIEEGDRTYNTRVAKIIYKFGDDFIVFNTSTKFGFLGATTEVTPDFKAGVMPALIKEMNLSSEPESKLTIQYTAFGDKYIGQGSIKKIKFDNDGSNCGVDDISFNFESPRKANFTQNAEEQLQLIRDGQISVNYTVLVPKIECNENGINLAVNNIDLTGNLVSSLTADYDYKIGNLELSMGEEYSLSINNTLFANRINKGDNDTFGQTASLSFDRATFNDPLILFFGGDPNKMKKLDNFILSVSLVDMAAEDYRKVFIELPKIVSENKHQENAEKIQNLINNVVLKLNINEISGKLDNGLFKIIGKSFLPINSIIKSSPEAVTADIKVSFDSKFVEAINPNLVRQINAFVKAKYLREVKEGSFESEIKFEDGALSFYGKHL